MWDNSPVVWWISAAFISHFADKNNFVRYYFFLGGAGGKACMRILPKMLRSNFGGNPLFQVSEQLLVDLFCCVGFPFLHCHTGCFFSEQVLEPM